MYAFNIARTFNTSRTYTSSSILNFCRTKKDYTKIDYTKNRSIKETIQFEVPLPKLSTVVKAK